MRKATADDDMKLAENKIREKEAFNICLRKIKNHGLPMRLIDVEFTFDVNKIIFYFTADGRIDFRELVKDLAAVSVPVSSCARSVCAMRPRCWAVSAAVAVRCAVQHS